MHLVLIHRHSDYSEPAAVRLHRFAVSNSPIAGIVFASMAQNYLPADGKDTVIAIPEDWVMESSEYNRKIITYSHNLLIPPRQLKQNGWFIVSNGRFIASVSGRVAAKLLSCCDSDIITIDVNPALSGYCEKTRFTTCDFLAGIRRTYGDSGLPQRTPEKWPHHVFLKNNIVRDVFADDSLPLSFDQFVKRCQDLRLRWQSFTISGRIIDLATVAGLLNLVQSSRVRPSIMNAFKGPLKDNGRISGNVRIFGKVFCGDDVFIGDDVTIIGPAIISDDVKIGSSAVIKNALIGPHVLIEDRALLRDCVVTGRQGKNRECFVDNTPKHAFSPNVRMDDGFRYWPLFSYARLGKRILDVLISSVVLMFFAPVFILVAIAVKLTSPGPVFFKHKRQGLHGYEFPCLKFRTMMVGADRIQEKLRRINEVDGPQFMLDDDPRVTVVGKFLRKTFIDELPQFINILMGQMSVAGPRPSPQSENLFCPSWRYARLSVRPGITGLWQVCRTRLPGRDFQEWIYYDTEYVKGISLQLDLKIFFKTVKKLINSFIEHF